MPVPWPTATPPAGWLKCDGRAFTKVKWSTKTGHRVRVFSSIDFPIRLVVTHHYIRAVLVRCNIQRYSPLLRELHR
ncbi:TPA: tail fiber protein [Escherichia coli O25b:H4-ST131]|nr:tail fiber protein [Escherichia coli O25b:H4-ST131]